MKSLRWLLLIGYVLATSLATVGHDHGVADDRRDAESRAADCGESRNHLHEHPVVVDLKVDDCLACKFQSQHRLILPVASSVPMAAAQVVVVAERVAAAPGPILRASSRAPPLV